MRKRGNLDFNVIVTSTYDEDGFLEWSVAPVGFDADGPGTTIPAEAHHPYGFQGRPNDADDPSSVDPHGSKVLVFSEGSVQHTIALDDPRVNVKLPQLPHGGSRQYDASGARAEFDGAGNWTLSSGVSYKVGSSPVALARGDALSQVITILENLAAGKVTAIGSVLDTSAAAILALQALKTIQTTEFEAT